MNISTRGNVLTGENVLISGFIIQGPEGATKRAVLRAIGPSLARRGVAAPLRDPVLELFNGSGVSIFLNDDWRDSQEGDIERTGLAPEDDLESAIVATLPPGSYTAVMSGVNGSTGVGLNEVYDVNTSSAARLVNISTRGRVGTDEDVLIGGFIIQGSGSVDVLLRAIGPSLANAGVSDALRDPTLELIDQNGNSTFNDDWRSNQEAEIAATGIPPSDDRESAIRAALAPGNYTAILSGKSRTTGVALVEFYSLQ